jgi:hypothetical protein
MHGGEMGSGCLLASDRRGETLFRGPGTPPSMPDAIPDYQRRTKRAGCHEDSRPGECGVAQSPHSEIKFSRDRMGVKEELLDGSLFPLLSQPVDSLNLADYPDLAPATRSLSWEFASILTRSRPV